MLTSMKKLLLLLLPIFLLFPSATHAAVAFGHASSNGHNSATSASWSHDATADNYLTVSLAYRVAVTNIAIDFNGNAMTLLETNNNTYDYQYVYGLANPDQGSYTISVSWTTSTYGAHTAGSFSGVGSLGTITKGTAPATTDPVTATATVAADGMLAGFYGIPDAVSTVAVTTGTERAEANSADLSTEGQSFATNTGTGSVDITWTRRAELSSWIAVPLVPAAATTARFISLFSPLFLW